MRYLVSDGEHFEGSFYRFAYDTKFKRFSVIEEKIGQKWTKIKMASDTFYLYFPGFSKNLRENAYLPFWAVAKRFKKRN